MLSGSSFVVYVMLQSLVTFLKFDALKNHTDLSEAVIGLLANLTAIDPSSFISAHNSNIVVQRIDSVCHLAYLVSSLL